MPATKEKTYNDAEIAERLKALSGWYYEDGWIRRVYKTDGWPTTLMLVNAIGYLAEAAYHHPDLTVTWGRVIVKLQNHAAGGISDKDFELARKIEEHVLWRPQGGALEEAVETILPETDTPGARAARVHVFVDLAARDCLAPADRQALVAGLDRLGAGFPSLAPVEKQRRLEAMDKPAFAVLKDLTMLGYFTSEIGCTQALAYEAVPGGYRGCLDLKPGQKAWAT